MTRLALIRRMTARGVLAMAAVVVACGWALAFAPTTQAQTAPAACPANLVLTLAAPTAAAPTTVTATVTPTVTLKAATAADPASFHVHYFIDVDPTTVVKPGEAIPTGNPQIVHSASLTQDLGTLSAGSHKVSVVLGQVSHQACAGADGKLAVGAVTFQVGAAAAAPPKTGQAGIVTSPRSTTSTVWGLIVLAALLPAAGRLLTAKRR